MSWSFRVLVGPGSNYSVIATAKASSLVLSSMIAQMMFGDVVKAQQVYRTARIADPDVRKDRDGGGWMARRGVDA